MLNIYVIKFVCDLWQIGGFLQVFRSGRDVQNYVIKFVSDLRQVGGFLRVLRFPPPIKLTTTINQTSKREI
jgi:hypothetical protein